MYVRCCYSVVKPYRADFVSFESLSYSSRELCKKIAPKSINHTLVIDSALLHSP